MKVLRRKVYHREDYSWYVVVCVVGCVVGCMIGSALFIQT